jgi:outer membrane receptor for ferrienterochelin and colicins
MRVWQVLLVVCGILFHTIAEAQDALVQVRVLHAGAALPGASVALGTRTLLTDSAGLAAFRVPPGQYELRVQLLGFAAETDTVMLSARDTALVVQLEESAVEAEEIIITSTRGERRVQDEPVKVEVVTREEVEEKLLMTPGSIAMLLNETSGLRVQETAPALGGAVIRVQGLRGRYTQLLADGLPLYGGQAGSLGVLQIPPVDLAQVEVIKGAASALYGASALGGAINLISRRPADDTEVLLNQTTRAGSDAVLWNARELSPGVGYTALLSGHVQEQQDVDSDGWADLPRYRRLVARPRLFLKAANGSRLMVTTGLLLEKRRGGGVAPDGSTFVQELLTNRFDAGATAQRPITNALRLDLRAAASFSQHDHRFGEETEKDNHRTGFAEASLRGRNGKHYWVAGAALQRDSYGAQQLRQFDYAYWIPSFFAQDEITFFPKLLGSFSVRADWHSEYGAFLGPRASLLLRLADFTSVRVSAGRGYFAPTPFTEETEEVGLGQVAIAGELRAETADILSADVNWTAAPFETNVSLFASRVDDAVQAYEVADRLTLANVKGDTRTYGVEALARFRREPWGLTASYTLIKATQPAAEGGRENVPLVPRHSASVVAVYEVHEAGRIGIEMYYTGRQFLEDNPFRNRSEPYVIVGLLMERRIGRVRAFLNMENLGNVRQSNYDPLVRAARTAAGRWTTDVWAPVDGRTFNGGVRLALH